jgi:hypothetical protein
MVGRVHVAIERHRIGHRVVQTRHEQRVLGQLDPMAGRPARVSGSFSSAARSRADTSPVCPPQAPQ